MTSLRQAIRRRFQSDAKDPAADPALSYRFYWTAQARTWTPVRRESVLQAAQQLIESAEFEPNAYERRYRIPALDASDHAGASLIALRDVLVALREYEAKAMPGNRAATANGGTHE